MVDEVERTGGCACETARYRVRGEPMFVNNCYCTLCQKQTGGTSVVNAFIEADAVTLQQGTLTQHVVETGRGGDHIIHRCAVCGTALFSTYPGLGELALGVRVGTLDDPASVTPDAVVFAENAMPWVTLPQGIPHFPKLYRIDEVLPPDRVARIHVLAERKKAAQ